MKSIYTLLPVDLALFDGAAGASGSAGAAAGAGDGAGAEGAQGGTQAQPSPTRKAKAGGLADVVYGKQAASAAQGSDAGSKTEGAQTPPAQEDRQAKFRELISGEYKDLYTADTQRIISRRYKDYKDLQDRLESQRPVIDQLMQRYKIADGDVGALQKALDSDDTLYAAEAESSGMSVQQYREYARLQRENARMKLDEQRSEAELQTRAQVQKWVSESEQVKQAYPGFDLAAESQDPQFIGMLKAGVPMQHAYEVMHLGDIKTGAAASAAKAAETNVVQSIRAKGARPAENGTSSQSSAYTYKTDVRKLTKADRAEIARRVERGEKIEF